MAAPTTHNLAHWIVTIGSVMITDFGESDAVTITADSDLVSHTASAGPGPGVRSVLRNDITTVEVTLTPGSRQNDALNEFIRADRLLGTGAFPMTIRNINGGSIYTSTAAWFKSRPKVTIGAEAKELVWTIQGNFTHDTRGLNF